MLEWIEQELGLDYVNMKELKINKPEQRKEYNNNSPLTMQNYSAIYNEEWW